MLHVPATRRDRLARRWIAALAIGWSAAACSDGGIASAPGADPPLARAYVPPPDAAACDPGDPARERHGTNCLCCHTGDFSVAGSVDLNGPPVQRIVVEDSVGARVEMSPDAYGNFFRHLPLVPPLRAMVYGADGGARAMPTAAPHAACNECHRTSGPAPPITAP